MNTERFPSPTLDALAASGELKTELHPSTVRLLKQMARYGGLGDRVSVAMARRRLQTLMPLVASSPPVSAVVDRVVSGPAGSDPDPHRDALGGCSAAAGVGLVHRWRLRASATW